MGEVDRGYLSCEQAHRRHGIQGRSTVLSWCRRYATHFVNFQQAGPTITDAPPAVAPTPVQRHKQVETALREQKHQYKKELNNAAELILLLRTMLQVVEEDHGLALPKKSFRRPFPAPDARQ